MTSRERTGVAAILAGVLIFAGQGGQLVFGDDVPDGLYASFGAAGFVALAVALWGLRELLAGTRVWRIGSRLALAGVAFLGLFAVHVFVELIRTGDIPENFVLFLIGFLLILVGQLLFARDLRPELGRGWVLPDRRGRGPRDGALPQLRRVARHRALRVRGRVGRARRRSAPNQAP